MVIRLSERWPEVSSDRLLSECVPPPRFADVRFATYRPDPNEPSQAEALAVLSERAAKLAQPRPAPTFWSRLRGGRGGGASSGARGSSGGRGSSPDKPGIYLDGGFGVGKTHLLASLWHEAAGPKMYCTFVELTNLVGA
ncbi:MAG TPA: AFG1/ZapE family ATPase, partial [Kribbella sp.]|nr:AFG1/ZapE family ATPase [Kribbella sp.]